MLIDLLSQTLERSGALENFWGKLDAGADVYACAGDGKRLWNRNQFVCLDGIADGYSDLWDGNGIFSFYE